MCTPPTYLSISMPMCVHGRQILLSRCRCAALSFKILTHRPPSQKWVFNIKKSPLHTYVNLDKHFWLFNITMTYKRSSDIQVSYGYCTRKNKTELSQVISPARNLAAGKKHLATWFVSNCGVQSKREATILE